MKNIDLVPSINTNKRKNPYLSVGLEELRDSRTVKVRQTKIVNTNVAREVLKQFSLHCVHTSRSHKDMFPIMLSYLLEKFNSEPFYQEKCIGDLKVDFSDKTNGNFEYLNDMDLRVKSFKATHLVKYQTIYEQAVIQYLNSIANE